MSQQLATRADVRLAARDTVESLERWTLGVCVTLVAAMALLA